MSDAIRTAIVRLRHFSGEFKEVRRIPANERKDAIAKIADRASETLMACWRLGYLRSIPTLQQRFHDLEQLSKRTPGFIGDFMFEMHLFEHLVGYHDAGYEEQVANVTYTDENGEDSTTEESVRYYYLPNGILAKDGLLNTAHIFIGPDMSEDEIALAKVEHSFEVLGYYSLGCEFLANFLESELAKKASPSTVDKNESNLASIVQLISKYMNPVPGVFSLFSLLDDQIDENTLIPEQEKTKQKVPSNTIGKGKGIATASTRDLIEHTYAIAASGIVWMRSVFAVRLVVPDTLGLQATSEETHLQECLSTFESIYKSYWHSLNSLRKTAGELGQHIENGEVWQRIRIVEHPNAPIERPRDNCETYLQEAKREIGRGVKLFEKLVAHHKSFADDAEKNAKSYFHAHENDVEIWHRDGYDWDRYEYLLTALRDECMQVLARMEREEFVESQKMDTRAIDTNRSQNKTHEKIKKTEGPKETSDSSHVNRRGRLSKEESQLRKTSMLAHLREHRTLKDNPELLANLVDVSASTIRRWLNELEEQWLADRKRESAFNDDE